MEIFHSCRTVPFKFDPRCLSMREDSQVWARLCRMKIGIGCTAARAVCKHCLQGAAAYLISPVEIGIERDSRFLGGSEVALHERVRRMACDREWTGYAVILTG